MTQIAAPSWYDQTYNLYFSEARIFVGFKVITGTQSGCSYIFPRGKLDKIAAEKSHQIKVEGSEMTYKGRLISYR